MKFGANFPEERPSINHREEKRERERRSSRELITARILLRVQRENCHCRGRKRRRRRRRQRGGGGGKAGGRDEARVERSKISSGNQQAADAATIYAASRALVTRHIVPFFVVAPPRVSIFRSHIANRKTFSAV